MDFNDSLRRAVRTGNVLLGPIRTEKCVKDGRARMIILAGNCEKDLDQKLPRMRTCPFTPLKVPAQRLEEHAETVCGKHSCDHQSR